MLESPVTSTCTSVSGWLHAAIAAATRIEGLMVMGRSTTRCRPRIEVARPNAIRKLLQQLARPQQRQRGLDALGLAPIAPVDAVELHRGEPAGRALEDVARKADRQQRAVDVLERVVLVGRADERDKRIEDVDHVRL